MVSPFSLFVVFNGLLANVVIFSDLSEVKTPGHKTRGRFDNAESDAEVKNDARKVPDLKK